MPLTSPYQSARTSRANTGFSGLRPGPELSGSAHLSSLDPKKRKLLEALSRQGEVNVPGASMVGKSKAREILKHGEVHGNPLSRKQRGLFGLIAGGGTPTRIRK